MTAEMHLGGARRAGRYEDGVAMLPPISATVAVQRATRGRRDYGIITKVHLLMVSHLTASSQMLTPSSSLRPNAWPATRLRNRQPDPTRIQQRQSDLCLSPDEIVV